MCLFGCFTYFTAFTPPFVYIVAQRGGKDECAENKFKKLRVRLIVCNRRATETIINGLKLTLPKIKKARKPL